MRILTISLNAWNDTMATGNTFSNFFQNLKTEDSIANIYCRNESVDNLICTNYFRVTEKDIIKNLFSKKNCGHCIEKENKTNEVELFVKQKSRSMKVFWNFMQKFRPSFLLFLREFFWNLNVWKNEKLDSFLLEFKPDIIYMHGHNNLYMHKLLWYCQGVTNAKVVLFFGDDMFNAKGERYLKKIYHKQLQNQLKYSIDHANIVFGGSPMLCKEYSLFFSKKFYLQIKTCENLKKPKEHENKIPLTIVYAGNLLYGRQQVLEEVSDVIREVNKDKVRFVLKIYSSNIVDSSTERKLNDNINSFLCGPRKFSDIINILNDCDLCIFPESFKDEYKKITRLSFSTKIIDYMESSSALLSYGPSDVSSINYIELSKIGYSANDRATLKALLQNIIDNPDQLNVSVKNKYNYALENHSKSTFLNIIRDIVEN